MPSPLIARLRTLAGHHREAVRDDRCPRSFAELYERALRAKSRLCAGAPSLGGKRTLLLASPGTDWVEAFFGIILGGGIAVPLSPLYPPRELAWLAQDAGAELAIVSADLQPAAAHLAEGRKVVLTSDLASGPTAAAAADDSIDAGDVALLLYTSGTTGKPKGAMITHGNIAIQAEMLRAAWAFTEQDRLLHALPLHHMHGLCISLMTALLAGASIRMLAKFDATRVWEEIAGGHVTAWMGVPTMYQKLLEAFEAAAELDKLRWARAAGALRLSVSGSAALPVTLAERWRAIAGVIPLERFGMTEIGVGFSNPIDPERRQAGHVGYAVPGSEARLVDEAGNEMDTGPGELWIRGPHVFAGYWQREEATREAFQDGWFRTGDIAERGVNGALRLLGRTSVDILKSGGYKLSALEIEEALRENGAVAEVAVVGIADEAWGQRVVAVVVPALGRKDDCEPDLLRAFLKERLAPYKVPRQILVTDALPRNAMGKVMKPELVRAIEQGEATRLAGPQ
jgi:malonyl-CoA/methylmalonyl-CoA synthetase